jgi:hypothetical protein
MSMNWAALIRTAMHYMALPRHATRQIQMTERAVTTLKGKLGRASLVVIEQRGGV